MSIGELLNWFFPFQLNQEQPFCKAFARFDLGLSRTLPTLQFKPSQVKYIDDEYADGTLEDERFNDPKLHWKPVVKHEVMNDGCCVMSLGAAQEIWKIYREATGTQGHMPSAFQGRIGGAKGLWSVDPDSSSGRDQSIWIEINKSQKKFEPHPEDGDEGRYDSHRLTFDLVFPAWREQTN